MPLAYDWRAQAASMRAAGLPEPFVETIETGWWTTCLEVVPPRERARGRYHLYREGPTGDGRPVMPLFGSPGFPPRLWIYTNFHCNLACDYCVVASSPQARSRSLGLERFRALVDEAVAEGFEEIYVTGGEPFVEPEIVDMLEYASTACRPSCLTNAMLFSGAAASASWRGSRAASGSCCSPRSTARRRRRTTAGAAREPASRRWRASPTPMRSACRCASR